jgi:hypothetical protein
MTLRPTSSSKIEMQALITPTTPMNILFKDLHRAMEGGGFSA